MSPTTRSQQLSVELLVDIPPPSADAKAQWCMKQVEQLVQHMKEKKNMHPNLVMQLGWKPNTEGQEV